jgi:alpha-N-arabinofuranosidase
MIGGTKTYYSLPVVLSFTFAAFFLATAARAADDEPSPDKPPAAAPEISVTIDAGHPGPAVSPFIYSQFIEHLGRCIYGGIWAEMLEDRKFYFPVTDKYDPYRSLKDSKFPVVGASPWESLGPADSVTMIKEHPFAGEHTPQVAAVTGIRQNDLGLVAGKEYTGYI